MKKILTIIIAVLYVAITSGFTVNVHYCMGKISSVKLHESDNDACGKCGKPGSKGGDCCKNVHKFLKVEESHQAAKVFAPHALFAMDLDLPVVIFRVQEPVAATVHASYRPNAPPLVPEQPLFLRNCVFLI